MRDFDQLLGRADAMTGIDKQFDALSAMWGIDKVFEALDPLSKIDSLNEKLDRIAGIDRIAKQLEGAGKIDGLTSKFDQINDLQRSVRKYDPTSKMAGLTKLDAASGVEGLIKKLDPLRSIESPTFCPADRLMADRALFDVAQDISLAIPLVRTRITVIVHRAPKAVGRCQVCKRPVKIDLRPDGMIEVFSPCECGALALDLLRETSADGVSGKPVLVVLSGGRPREAGRGTSIGNLTLVKPAETKRSSDG